jgi:hypothetical protein
VSQIELDLHGIHESRYNVETYCAGFVPGSWENIWMCVNVYV